MRLRLCDVMARQARAFRGGEGTSVQADEPGMASALHSRLRAFLARFNGVSARRLGMYLRWFEWLEQARRSDASRTAMLEAQAANGRYSVRRRSLFAEPHPFWDYWEGKRPVVDVESLYPPEVISGLV